MGRAGALPRRDRAGDRRRHRLQAIADGRSERGGHRIGTGRAGADAQGDLDVLRTESLRHYLRCYAPTTSGHFAEWAGITKSDAKPRWAAVADSLVAVWCERKGFVLEEDLDAVDQPPASTGARLLPAKDAFLQAAP